MKIMIVDKNIHRTEEKEKEGGRKNPLTDQGRKIRTR
jgi:hypothetical protein